MLLTGQDFEKEVNKAKGVNTLIYQEKREWLVQRWSQEDDCTEIREIGPIIVRTPSPLNTALIADNLAYFKDHYTSDIEYSKQGLELALKRACLCGSKEVAEFLLIKLDANYTLEQYSYILGHVSASMNTGWMKEIASKMVQAKAAMPEAVLRLASTEDLIEIEEIFKENQRPPVNSSIR